MSDNETKYLNLLQEIYSFEDDEADKLSSEDEDTIGNFKSLICKMTEHTFEIDHCGKEEHDYCVVCMTTANGLGFKRDWVWDDKHEKLIKRNWIKI